MKPGGIPIKCPGRDKNRPVLPPYSLHICETQLI